MSIPSFIKRLSVQTICYWANPVLDGYGTATYDDAVEIEGRWEDITKTISNNKGEETITNTQVMTNEELEVGEILYLGTLDDLTALNVTLETGKAYPTPKQVEGSYKIKTKDKIPLIRSSTVFVRMYYLKPNWETKL